MYSTSRGYERGREARRIYAELQRWVADEWKRYTESINEAASEVSDETPPSPVPLYPASLRCEM